MSAIENLKKSLTHLLTGDRNVPTTAWIISKTPLLMQTIEKANSVLGLSGSKKKDLLIQIICDHIEAEEDPEDEAALYFAKHVLPTLIDTLVSVDIRELRIKVKACLKCKSCRVA
jgi:hypothetical protein